MAGVLVGTDIGGTFTDLVAYDALGGGLSFAKTLTTYTDLVDGISTCLSDAELHLDEVEILKHGTTQVINVLLERRGARVALVTTEGFRDVLEIGRANRPLAFKLDYRRPPPLVPAFLRLEVRERIASDGTVLLPLDERELASLAMRLTDLGVDAVAVSFLNAYANPCHEQAVAATLRTYLPDAFVSAGTELTREWLEYERTSTAVANAYVGPRVARYVERLGSRLSAGGFAGRLLLMASNGGTLSVERSRTEPVALVESGPIGGAIGAARYAEALALPHVVAFDMGGTTAKCVVIDQGRFEVGTTYYVGGYDYGFPIRTSVLDIVEVGTGGGSLAAVRADGSLQVGPESAGSEPGPVGFGRGGIQPTVADANLALDRISSDAFLGGGLALDRAAARAAILERIGRPLGYGAEADIDRVASGILALAGLQMAGAIKEVTIERGRDVRDFVLFVFGGGGPLHGTELARELGISRVVVPPEPGNFSALGMLLADARADATQTVLLALDEAEDELCGAWDALQAKAIGSLRADRHDGAIRFERSLEARFRGQRHAIRLRADAMDVASLRVAFLAAYRTRYGFADDTSAIEVVSVSVGAIGLMDKPCLTGLHRAAPPGFPPVARHREVCFDPGQVRIRTAVFRRSALPIGFTLSGPAVIEEYGATTLVGPGDRLTVGKLGELDILLGREA